MKRNLFFLMLVGLLLSACATAQKPSNSASGSVVKVDGGSYTNVSPTELQTMLKNKDFTFVNVHIPFEGNIAQTDVSVPYDQIDQNMAKLPADKNAKIVLYCRSGRMSDIAARKLVSLGYTNLYNLDGGFNAWKAAGLPLQMQP